MNGVVDSRKMLAWWHQQIPWTSHSCLSHKSFWTFSHLSGRCPVIFWLGQSGLAIWNSNSNPVGRTAKMFFQQRNSVSASCSYLIVDIESVSAVAALMAVFINSITLPLVDSVGRHVCLASLVRPARFWQLHINQSMFMSITTWTSQGLPSTMWQTAVRTPALIGPVNFWTWKFFQLLWSMGQTKFLQSYM